MKITLGVMFFIVGNVLAWFQFNSQFVWDWWKDKPIIANLIFAIPMGFCFWYAVKNIVEETGLLWSSKIIGFGVGQVIFAVLTYALMKESIFTTKTLVCILLSIVIIWIQVAWK
tara:strand:- start:268 stop:609 length:342 start_codon:yes stop_codon:yes gene_type:complete